ncbi:RND multidrug efflux transporter [Proteus myxofaciens ATCC 19692]|uniref:RND multidrug efflux transporter n=1 Tax=Proteus myxofaciens ATCC 19692 TaxID=1354337 RepID=A0A198FR82_9GAMM|nr:RND multidrug efflux transporter [Proteus myxofaciens ATCC 19692]
MLKPFDERNNALLSANSIATSLMGKFSQIQDGFVGIFPPPPVPGLGAMGGFKLQLEDRAGLGFNELSKVQGKIVKKSNTVP